VAVHDVRRSGLQVGDRAVVLGGGPIGVLIACVARQAGADVLIAEIDESRRDRIAGLGFTVSDVVFEVSGAAAAVRSATGLARVRGTIVIVAIHAAPREVDLQRLFWRELRVLGARVYQRSDFERAISLLSLGAIPVSELITDVVPLDRTGDAIADLSAGRAMKILVDVAGQDQA
jgi:(R,R)-butanediol dehydrogenase / meso-butanediol dehydrogenase / diacetyl reductase